MTQQSRYQVPRQTPASSILKGLVGLNVAVYVLWQILGKTEWGYGLMGSHFLLSAESVFSLRIWTMLSMAFSHVGFGHLLFNMIALWIFGREVEAVIGSSRLLHLYIVGALLSSIGHVGFSLLTGDPTPALGASGAVMAIAVQYGALFPKRILLLNFFIPVPAALAIAGWIVMDVMGMFSGGSTVAHAAHLGGAVYGLIHHFRWVKPRLRRV